MENQSDIVRAIADKYDCSFYRVAKMLGVSPQKVIGIKNGYDTMSKPMADKCAALLDMEPAFLRLITDKERAKDDDVKASYERLIKSIAPSATTVAALVLAVGLAIAAPVAQAASTGGTQMYIMLNRARRRLCHITIRNVSCVSPI